MKNNIICGGGIGQDVGEFLNNQTPMSERTCSKFENGTWKISHNLEKSRTYHSSWKVDEGVILIGGWSTDTNNVVPTADLVKFDGTIEHAFNLKYLIW